MKYTLFQTGPDDSSTYAECWGSNSSSPGRHVASASDLLGLMDAVDGMDHDNWWIRGPGGRNVANTRREYYALPTVAKALARIDIRDN